MSFRNPVLRAPAAEALTQWGMHVHMRLQPRAGNTARLGLPSALLFLQQEILFQHNLRTLSTKPHQVSYRCIPVSAKTHQHHLDWTECTRELLEYPERCPGQARQIPAQSKLRKCARLSAWETRQVCDKPTERCPQNLRDWVLASAEQSAVKNLECLILHPRFIPLTYAFQNSVKSTAV